MATRKAAVEDKLEIFRWEGVDKRGQKIKGEQAAKTPALVKAELRKQGINPKVVKKKPKSLFSSGGKKSIKPADIAFFSRQIATMLSSGVPLVQGIEIIGGGHQNPAMQELLGKIRDDVSGGTNFSDALAKHPKYFDDLYINLVKAGESAGVLDTLLDTIASYKENIESLKGKIKKALFYPAAVVVVAIIVTFILLLFVVPVFQEMFQGFGADLPAFTLFVIGISENVQAYWWMYFLVIGGGVFALLTGYKRSRKFRQAIDRMMLKIPIVGPILNESAIARFARTLSITFKAGVPLVDGLETTAGATGNIVYEEAVNRIREDVSVGYQVKLAMEQTKVFPHMVVQMTGIGEEAGSLDQMLDKVADFYEERVNNAVDSLSSLLEPFIMVIIGTLVGGLVIAMYLPIFKIAAVV
jgi:type IV pilus assembly protein PilC